MTFLKKIFNKDDKPKPTRVELNRAEHKKLKDIWDKSKVLTGGRPIELREEFYDRNGNIYYVHKNITDFHIARHEEYNKAIQGIQWSIQRDQVKRRIKDIISDLNICEKLAKSGNPTAIESQLNSAKEKCDDVLFRMDLLPEKRLILELAMVLIYRHDENPYLWEPQMKARKLQDAANDPNLEGFFLSAVWGTLKTFLTDSYLMGDKWVDFGALSYQDFQDYLMEEKIKKMVKSSG